MDTKETATEAVKVVKEVPVADRFIAEKKLGERIKRLRLKKSMGLVELGRHTALSASFLSQLETGRVVPTLRNLARIAMVFSKDLSYFFDPEPTTLLRVHRQAERVRLPQHDAKDPGYFFESLGYQVPDRALDPYFAEIVPLKKGQELKAHLHPGFEFLYVMEGSLEIKHAENVEKLEAGDAVYFDATTPHSYRCVSRSAVRALIVTTQQMKMEQAAANSHSKPVAQTSAAAGAASNGSVSSTMSARQQGPPWRPRPVS